MSRHPIWNRKSWINKMRLFGSLLCPHFIVHATGNENVQFQLWLFRVCRRTYYISASAPRTEVTHGGKEFDQGELRRRSFSSITGIKRFYYYLAGFAHSVLTNLNQASHGKQSHYNRSAGMYSLDVVHISRVQVDQHAGWAGITRPGKIYCLYPSSIYLYSLAGSVLYLKSFLTSTSWSLISWALRN